MESGENITSLQIDEVGAYPVFGGNGLRGYADRFTHYGTYALIGRQGALWGNINYASGKFWASEHAVIPTLVRGASVQCFGNLIRTMNHRQYSQSAAQPGLSVEMIGKLDVRAAAAKLPETPQKSAPSEKSDLPDSSDQLSNGTGDSTLEDES